MGVEEFVVARNPDADSSLPFLVRLPPQPGPVVLKVREAWPRTSKVYCHPSEDWSEDWPADPLAEDLDSQDDGQVLLRSLSVDQNDDLPCDLPVAEACWGRRLAD